MKFKLLLLIGMSVGFFGCAKNTPPDYNIEFGKVSRSSVFKSEEFSIWGGSVVKWEDGEVQQFDHLERPQVYIENGEPIALMCAADLRDEDRVRHSFNVQIPLKITKEHPEE